MSQNLQTKKGISPTFTCGILILTLILLKTTQFTNAIRCYHCTSLPFNSTFHRSDCNNSNVPDEYLMECGQWPWPGAPVDEIGFELLQKQGVNSNSSMHDIIMGEGGSLQIGNFDTQYPNDSIVHTNDYTLDLICVKVDADMQNVHHVVRGCIFALLKDMVNRCENLDYDYETINGITLNNMKVCFCNQDACNSAMGANYLWSGFIILLWIFGILM